MARISRREHHLRPIDMQANHLRGRPRPSTQPIAPPRNGNDRYVRHHDEVGRGRYSSVRIVTDVITSSEVAVKIMKRSCVSSSDFLREVNILQRIAKLPAELVALRAIISSGIRNALPTFQSIEIALQLLQATQFLHDHGIIHTDLNPSNVMLLDVGKVKHFTYTGDDIFEETAKIQIIDFGSVGEDVLQNKGHVGSPGYRSPEIILGWSWTETVDHFAIGCIIAETVLASWFLPVVTQSVVEDLHAMEITIGPFPDDMREEINAQQGHTHLLDADEYDVINGVGTLKASHHESVMGDHILYTTIEQLTRLDKANRTSLKQAQKRPCFRRRSNSVSV
ncbi:kinase-like domain-containing protein [Mycena rebaudengoi]|nr:kinase-like domain-containing protein [Mycena rebaudengoi]